MTDKNFVHGSVQRSEQELNPLSVTLFHTLQNWYLSLRLITSCRGRCYYRFHCREQFTSRLR